MRKTGWILLFIISGVWLLATAQPSREAASGTSVEKKRTAFRQAGVEPHPKVELISGLATETSGCAGNQKIPSGSIVTGAYHRLIHLRSVKAPDPLRGGFFAKDYIDHIFPSHNFW